MIFLGITTSLSLPPFNYLLINFLTFTLLLLFLIKKISQNSSSKLFFFYGWSFGFGYFLSSLYWISIALTFDENFKFLIPLTIILIPTLLAVFYGLVTYLFKILKPKNTVSSFLTFSLLFSVLEYVRGTILTGFPWNLIAYSFSNHLEILSFTSVIGTYGFNLFCISLFSSPLFVILKKKRKDIGIFIFFIIMTIGAYIYGQSNKEKFYTETRENHDYKIRVVGSNIGLDRFYNNIDSILVIEDLIKLSNPNPNDKTIFIWPEGILPDISQEDLIEYKWLFEKSFSKNHFLIIGINNLTSTNGTKDYFNSLSVYDNKLNLLNSYNKINLVPFGEFLPFEKFLNRIGLKSLVNNYQSFSSGDERKVIEIKQKDLSLKFLPLICYEIIYTGRLFLNSDFDLIVNISEDGWFGQSTGPKQHFVHSIFRSIENGKYLVRSANNGTSAIINPLGIVEQSVNFGESGYIDLKETRKIQPTIFSRYGNKIFGILILLYIFLIFSSNRFNNE